MNPKDIRTLHSNCEHSFDGCFRVHLTEADYTNLLAEVERLTEECVEAQATVEVLRGVVCGTADKLDEEASGPCGVCLKCAYRRGVNAAADELDRLLTKKKATAIWVSPDELRAIPNPEDK